MTARPANYEDGQHLADPFLNDLDDRNWDFFPTTVDRDLWVQDRLERHRPVPDGKPILITSTRLVQHYNNGSWVTKFERLPPLDLRPPPHRTRLTPRQLYGWHRPPLAAAGDEYTGLIHGGGAPAAADPFTPDQGTPPGIWSVTEHANHRILTVFGPPDAVGHGLFTATVQTGFDCQIICVGAGGAGQDWYTTGTYVGGIGGGAGMVVTIPWRFHPGDTFTCRPGIARLGTYQHGITRVSSPADTPILEAVPGSPQVSGTSYRDEEAALPTEAIYGCPSGYTAHRTSISNVWSVWGQHRYYALYYPAARGQTTPRLFGIKIYGGSTNASFGRTTARGPERIALPSGGVGANPDDGRGPVVWDPASGGRERNIGGVRASNPGGPGISLAGWFPAETIVAEGGPPGSTRGPGNARLGATVDRDGTAQVLAGVPTGWGSGGRGGGASTSAPDRKGSLGTNGVVFIRYPTPGNPFVYTDLGGT